MVHKRFALSLLKLIAAKTKVPDVSIYCKLMFPATVFFTVVKSPSLSKYIFEHSYTFSSSDVNQEDGMTRSAVNLA